MNDSRPGRSAGGRAERYALYAAAELMAARAVLSENALPVIGVDDWLDHLSRHVSSTFS